MPTRSTRVDRLGPFLAAASSKEAIRDRIFLIAHERGLAPAAIDAALNASTRTDKGSRAIVSFCMDNEVSIDWLVTGDLRALHRRR